MRESGLRHGEAIATARLSLLPMAAPFLRASLAGERDRAEALLRWAHERHGVRRFVLSIGPGNHASQRLAGRLGFERVGEWVHEVRGLELVYRRVLDGPEPSAGG